MNYGQLPSYAVMKKLADETKGMTSYALEDGLVNFSYAILEKESFNNPLAREFRGMLYDVQNETPVIRGFHKFFNLDEREENRFENLPWADLVDIQVKLDGTCIMASLYNGRLIVKTKNSMKGDLVDQAREMILANDKLVDILKAYENEGTLIFERLYTGHDESSGVVTEYAHDELVLLTIRNNKEGYYYGLKHLAPFVKVNQRTVQEDITLHEILNSPDDMKHVRRQIADMKAANHEGFILVFKDRMVKVKTDTYLNQVSTLSNLNDREVARLVLEDKLDDIRAFVHSRFEGKFDSRIDEIEKSVNQGIDQIDAEVRAYDTKGLQGKELYDSIKDHPYAAFISNHARGKYQTNREQLANMWRKVNLKDLSNHPWNKWNPEV